MATLEEIQNEKIITLGNLQAFYDKLNSDVVSNIHSQITSTNNAVAAVDTAVDALSETFDGHVTDNNNKFTEVNNKFTEVNNKITEIEGLVADNTEAINTEKTRAEGVEATLSQSITTEVAARESGDATTLESAKDYTDEQIEALSSSTNTTTGNLETRVAANETTLAGHNNRITVLENLFEVADSVDDIITAANNAYPFS